MPATREGRSRSILPGWLRKSIAVFAYNQGNYETAFDKFLPLAEQGSAEAQYYLGLMYSEGQGVLQDEAEALNWCRKAAAQGDPNARFLVGLQMPVQPDAEADAEPEPEAVPAAAQPFEVVPEQAPTAPSSDSAPVYELTLEQALPPLPAESVPTDRSSPEQAPTVLSSDSAPAREGLLEPAPTVQLPAPPSEADSVDEGVAGYRFSAVLQIDTPIHVLRMHGRFVASGDALGDYPVGPDADLGGRHGQWLPTSNRDDDLEAARPSDIGPVKPSAYLPFLKAFRRIVESDQPADRQAARICALKQTWPEFWEQLSRNHSGLDERWFVSRLRALPGVGRNAARALYAAGHLVADQVLALPDEALLAVRGIGKATVAKLRSAAPAEAH